MNKYKLKPEARKFFNKDLSTQVKDLSWWNKNVIPEELLNEVGKVHVEYGHRKSEIGISLSGWKGEEQEGEFLFTVKVSDMSNKDYTAVNISVVMDEIQNVLDKYFKNNYQ